jgi:peptidoglycan/LPS O-acetylase OafA/YrhL
MLPFAVRKEAQPSGVVVESLSDRKPALSSLTALRFFAAVAVVLYHVAGDVPRTPLTRSIGGGFTAVTAFFLLSGFILAYNHPVVPKLSRFFRSRFARVYPLYALSILIGIHGTWSALRMHPHQFWDVPATLLLVQAWIPGHAGAFNTFAWSLSCEAFFYVTFPFVVARLARVKFHRGYLIVIAVVLQVSLMAWCASHANDWSMATQDFVYKFPPMRLLEFIIGILLGLQFRERPWRSSGWAVAGAVLICIAALEIPYYVEAGRDGLMLAPLALLICVLAGRTSKVLGSPILQLGGEISYGLYILQIASVRFTYLIGEHFHVAWMMSPWRAIVNLPLAWAAYTLIEKPARSLLLGHKPRKLDKPIPTPQAIP